MERKRWRIARVTIWTTILGATALFWVTAAAAAIAWLR